MLRIPLPDPLEVHSGVIVGRRRSSTPSPPLASGAAPRQVLDELLLDALVQQPCHVAFSGGRDSSVVLAATTAVARRHGLPDPIPLTARYPHHPRASEVDWQELVVRHLELADWTVFDVTTQLDALGDIALGALKRHGAFWPPNGYSMRLMSRMAGTGTLLTGSGGDELFTSWTARRVPLRSTLRRRPIGRAMKWSAYYALPGRLRHELDRHLATATVPWLQPEAQRQVNAALRSDLYLPRVWADVLARLLDGRYYELVRPVLGTFAADEGVRLAEPLYHPRFVQAVMRHGPAMGFPNRGRALEELFGDLLPGAVVHRSTKASFNEVAWGPAARAFAERWDGTGLDTALVDPGRLRQEWMSERPDVRCLGSLHKAWLVSGRIDHEPNVRAPDHVPDG